jgi:hypothetical protein
LTEIVFPINDISTKKGQFFVKRTFDPHRDRLIGKNNSIEINNNSSYPEKKLSTGGNKDTAKFSKPSLCAKQSDSQLIEKNSSVYNVFRASRAEFSVKYLFGKGFFWSNDQFVE